MPSAAGGTRRRARSGPRSTGACASAIPARGGVPRDGSEHRGRARHRRAAASLAAAARQAADAAELPLPPPIVMLLDRVVGPAVEGLGDEEVERAHAPGAWSTAEALREGTGSSASSRPSSCYRRPSTGSRTSGSRRTAIAGWRLAATTDRPRHLAPPRPDREPATGRPADRRSSRRQGARAAAPRPGPRRAAAARVLAEPAAEPTLPASTLHSASSDVRAIGCRDWARARTPVPEPEGIPPDPTTSPRPPDQAQSRW